MWKKDQAPEPMLAGLPDPVVAPERPMRDRQPGEIATIGRSITIRGEVTGDEDLLIQGKVEGSVNLKQHAVTVGPQGEVKADIVGRVIVVEGRVVGNFSAEEQVVLRHSARVQGDITAPRVLLEDGAYFRGGIDMGESKTNGKADAVSRRDSASSAEPVKVAAGSDASSRAESSTSSSKARSTETPAEALR